ncbi:MAG: hypothetical protein DRJ61_08160 [Acidobacteria bacterium]|nr:MAG: hypothetical protein DRJ65_19470 [Acidobacteriota bacterium]RLE33022.1 MAG: hypothetical protein DRJ61_08160 [Acidobacteriota bacterium]
MASRTHAQKVKLVKTDNDGLYFDLKNHNFVKKLPSILDRIATHGGIVRWRVRRSSTDSVGGGHTFFSQFYVPPKGWSNFPDGVPEGGYPLIGGEFVFHSDSEGEIYGVSGAYFTQISHLNEAVISSSEAALVSATSAVLSAGYQVVPFEFLSAATRDRIQEAATLEIHPVPSQKGAFGFGWRLPLIKSKGGSLFVTLDAVSGEILKVWDGLMTWDDPCTPETYEQHSAIRDPLNPDILESSDVFVTEKPSAADHFDAHRVRGSYTPDILVYRAGYDACDGHRYELIDDVPLNNSQPLFGETETLQAAGDAQAHAAAAFRFWGQWIGFYGPSGSIYSPAKMTVSAACWAQPGASGAGWTSPNGSDNIVEAGGVYFCPPAEAGVLQFASAQDIVAHEWGHSALFSATGWGYDFVPGGIGSLHEGWADVLGQGVEWMTQVRTVDLNHPQAGEADWMSGEDSYLVVRRADSTDAVSNPLLMPRYRDVNNQSVPYLNFNFLSFHKDDIADLKDGQYSPHYEGHKANVVFYLMVEGVENPGHLDCTWGICVPLFQENHAEVGLAYEYLAKMLLMETTSTDGWEDLADNLTFVGPDVPDKVGGFKAVHIGDPITDPCLSVSLRYSALRAGYEAFGNIGYPPSTPICSDSWQDD